MAFDGTKVARRVAPASRPAAGNSRQYSLQVVAVTVYIAAALVVVEEFGHLHVIGAIASSAFLVFCLPAATMSRPRNILGGYLTAVISAGLAAPLTDAVDPGVVRDSIAALTVGVSLAVMNVTHTEHVPAAGTTLILVLGSLSWEVAASTLLLAAVLAALHSAGRGRLVNVI